ncbi:putative protein kinase UbiB [Rubripirellula lacrimiformis]|uniref:ABC1 atypical kinase-like domain-containing protein n=1 Tax=Rubripirellula lacrimiformis TaxID=1930273 RepID=A0A517N4N5_9BACT|nr:AarF/UbiB family protein [Rubripirellula lacrimiformis]QDT02089.1 putative protein kinase UbiB [Rubripirellula lacrimiformis]
MDLTDVPQLVRNADRFREVVTVLGKHGLADWLANVPVSWLDRFRGPLGDDGLTTHARIRVAMTELGTTFIKLGQVLSTRPDLIGEPLSLELAQLRANTPADRPETVISMVQSELGAPIEELFGEFDPVAFASASIGQVHHARTLQGKHVVVKVQHAGIERRIVNDLEIIEKLCEIAEQQSNQLQQYRPVKTVREFSKSLSNELDFGRELKNMQRFRRNFETAEGIRFAQPYPELSSRRVLTMECFEGISVSEKPQLDATGFDLDQIACRGANVFLDMIFRDGFYHADPHPGNLMILLDQESTAPQDSADPTVPLPTIGILDCGMVGRIDDQLREDLELSLIASVGRDAKKIAEVVARVGEVPSDFDEPAMLSAIEDLIDDYGQQSLQDFDLSGCLRDIVAIIRDHRVYLPAKVAMLLKLLVMLEGTAHQLSPRFNLVELITPYAKKAMLRRFSPRHLYSRLKSNADDWQNLFGILPKDVADILTNLKRGKFDIHLQHRRLEPIVNRLVMGILAAALFVGSASLWSNQVPPMIGGFSLPGFAGCLIAVVMGYRISRDIRRSSRSSMND